MDLVLLTGHPTWQNVTSYVHITSTGMVEPRGVEPLTSCMPCKRSTN